MLLKAHIIDFYEIIKNSQMQNTKISCEIVLNAEWR